MNVVMLGGFLLCRERASDGGQVREATQLGNRPRHERLQVAGTFRIGSLSLCHYVNMY